MDTKSYGYCIEAVASRVPRSGLDAVFREGSSTKRVDGYVSLLRMAFGKCSIGTFNGEVYFFTGRIWELLGYDGFGNLIYDVMESLGVPQGDYGRIEGIVRVCRRVVSVRELHLSVDRVVFRNCVYNVRENRVEDFSPECVQFSQLDYDYDANAKGYIWDEFLRQVLPLEGYRNILQEYIGSLFVARTEARMETMMILKGSGSNGKSVVFDTIIGILGRENVSNFGIDELCGGGSERKRNIATMNGKRLNYASETRKFVIDGSSGTLKALISGEPIEARAMYGSNFTAYDIPQIMINTNQMPEIKDWSYGMRRRLCIIPFNVEIPKWRQNKSLSSELRKEYSYIFNWAMQGRRKFVANQYKLDENAMMEEVMEEYYVESNSVLLYLSSTGYEKNPSVIIDQPPVWIQFKNLYADYCRWCLANDEFRENTRRVNQILREAGYKSRRFSGTSQFAFYGDKAMALQKETLRKKNEQKKLLLGKVRDLHMNVSEIRAMMDEVRRDTGWKRFVAGFKDLAEYIELPVNVQYEMMRGSLEGFYEIYKGIYFFNLDDIDEYWKPKYESRLRGREVRKAEKRRNKEILEEAMQQGSQVDVNRLSIKEILNNITDDEQRKAREEMAKEVERMAEPERRRRRKRE